MFLMTLSLLTSISGFGLCFSFSYLVAGDVSESLCAATWLRGSLSIKQWAECRSNCRQITTVCPWPGSASTNATPTTA